jgi:hypothetical protein
MDKYYIPLKEGRRAKGAGQALQNCVRASRNPKKKFVAKQFASAEICREAIVVSRRTTVAVDTQPPLPFTFRRSATSSTRLLLPPSLFAQS